MLSLIVPFLIFILFVAVFAAVVIWILSNIPGIPPWSRNVVLAIAGIAVLIWLVDHFGRYAGIH